MPLQAYHRPESVEAALALLGRSHVRTAVIAGGTHITPRLKEDVDEVVDLQAVGRDEVQHTETGMTVGAMVRLQSIVDDENAPELLRQTAHSVGPNTFRHQGTVGGAFVAADATSELLAALLVHQAQVTVANDDGERQMSLSEFLSDTTKALNGGLLTSVSLVKTGTAARARVARTPADAPIVAAAGRRDTGGALYLALCGVASTPILADPDDLDTLTPPADFRGSSEYRREMAKVLAERVLREVREAS
ncbi:MAG TPA: FAD binding domain-containing protein [Candidatus Sulfomarinibacteraceae bacterium]|nr:FAD binding domain-containing protein [Candidatus Sulfomarinibacteraceae bacterium]